MTDTEHPLDYLDAPTRILKRAQYEAMTFELFETNVLVRNESYTDPENHEYLVEIDDGLPVSCPCPADEHYENACKHRVAVAMRRPIIDFASDAKLVADGGSLRSDRVRTKASQNKGNHGNPSADEDETDCACAVLPDDVPCWECYRTGVTEFK